MQNDSDLPVKGGFHTETRTPRDWAAAGEIPIQGSIHWVTPEVVGGHSPRPSHCSPGRVAGRAGWGPGEPFPWTQTLKLHPPLSLGNSQASGGSSPHPPPQVNEAQPGGRLGWGKRRRLPPHVLLCAAACLAHGAAGSKHRMNRRHGAAGPGTSGDSPAVRHVPRAQQSRMGEGVRSEGDPGCPQAGWRDQILRAGQKAAGTAAGGGQGGQGGWDHAPRLLGKVQA